MQTADITQNGIMFGRLTESIVDTLGTFSSFNEAMYILTSLQVSPIPVPGVGRGAAARRRADRDDLDRQATAARALIALSGA